MIKTTLQNEINKNIYKYFDYRGFIGNLLNQDRRDFGDACQRSGLYHFGLYLRKKIGLSNADFHYKNQLYFLNQMISLQNMNKKGLFRRYRCSKYWYSDFDRQSRDQETPRVVACVCYDIVNEYNFDQFMVPSFIRRLTHFFFMDNTRKNWQYKTKELQEKYEPGSKWDYSWKLPDIVGPEHICIYLRYFMIKHKLLLFLYPLLFIGDLETLINAIIRRFNNDKDVSNHVVISLFTFYHLPTIISRLTCRINLYSDMLSKMRRYFNGPDPEFFVDLYKPLMKKAFNNGRKNKKENKI